MSRLRIFHHISTVFYRRVVRPALASLEKLQQTLQASQHHSAGYPLSHSAVRCYLKQHSTSRSALSNNSLDSSGTVCLSQSRAHTASSFERRSRDGVAVLARCHSKPLENTRCSTSRRKLQSWRRRIIPPHRVQYSTNKDHVANT